MDYGFKLGANGGFLNIAGNFTGSQKTFRQITNTDNFLTDRDALYPNYVRRANGDGSLVAGGAMLNMEVPLNETGRSTFYAFGGYNYKNPTPMRSPALILQDLTVSQRTRKVS